MSIGCHMMLLNAEATLERALRPLAGHITELSVVDTGSTDNTVELCRQIASGLLGLRSVRVLTHSPASHPQLYLRDVSETWKGVIPGPFTGEPILANWGEMFQLAAEGLWSNYTIRVDADDIVLGASNLKQLVSYFDHNPSINAIAVPYEIMSPTGELQTVHFMPRIFRKIALRWTWVMHEQLRPRRDDDQVTLASGLRMRDMNDNPGKVKIAHRNAKVLYKHYLDYKGKPIERPLLMTIGHEMIDANPQAAHTILTDALHAGPPDDDVAKDIELHLGRAAEALENWPEAQRHYSCSIAIAETANALARRSIVKRKMTPLSHIPQANQDLAKAEMLNRQRGSVGVWLPWLREAQSV